MSKFWQKKYISKYTGAEIDAAVAAGSQIPEVTVEDAGMALVVNEEGKIVSGAAGGRNVNTLSDTAEAAIQLGIQGVLPTLISTGKSVYSYTVLNTDETSFTAVENIETSLAAGKSTEVLSVNGLDFVLNKSFHITAGSEIIPILTAVSAIELLSNTIYLVVFDIEKVSDTQYMLTFNFQQLSADS